MIQLWEKWTITPFSAPSVVPLLCDERGAPPRIALSFFRSAIPSARPHINGAKNQLIKNGLCKNIWLKNWTAQKSGVLSDETQRASGIGLRATGLRRDREEARYQSNGNAASVLRGPGLLIRRHRKRKSVKLGFVMAAFHISQKTASITCAGVEAPRTMDGRVA
jgi:hypothetical protein